MSDPKLKSASVRMIYTSTDGYRAETGFSSRQAATPQEALLGAIDELARVLALFGFADEAQAAVTDACERVKAHRAPTLTPAMRDDAASIAGIRKQPLEVK